jgi:hypothetical protein
MSGAYFGAAIEGIVDMEESGKIKGGKVRMAGSLHYLSEKEAVDTWNMNQHGVRRPWALWAREVECSPPM